jgi:Lar family restriction alleviation protein
MTDELKPCPFCGASVSIRREGHQWDTEPCYIGCHTCGLFVQLFDKPESRELTIAAWNLRHESDTLPVWAIEAIDRCLLLDGKTVAYQSGVLDTLDWVLALRKPEEKE